MNCLLDSLVILASYRICYYDICTEGYSEESVDNEIDDRCVRAYGSHAGFTQVTREVAYDSDISRVECLLKDSRHCQRKSKSQDLIPETSFGHRVFSQFLGIHMDPREQTTRLYHLFRDSHIKKINKCVLQTSYLYESHYTRLDELLDLALVHGLRSLVALHVLGVVNDDHALSGS